jgi:hypothetical protein
MAAAFVVLMASGAANPADAGRSGHGGGSGRSFGGGSGFQNRSFNSGSFQMRSQFRAPSPSGNSLQLRSYARPPTNLVQRPRSAYGPAHPHNWRSRRHRRHILLGVPVIYGGYYYYYGDCDWLRRRALVTGSLYWWDRYNACIYGGY